MTNLKLTIELIPSTAWFKNLRNVVGDANWDVIKKACYQNANYRCEICGGRGPKWPVECHERWQFTEGRIILEGLIALCPSCHEVKHIGFASTRGRLEHARRHFMKVNGISLEEANEYIVSAFSLFEKRSKKDWELDFTYLDKYLSR